MPNQRQQTKRIQIPWRTAKPKITTVPITWEEGIECDLDELYNRIEILETSVDKISQDLHKTKSGVRALETIVGVIILYLLFWLIGWGMQLW